MFEDVYGMSVGVWQWGFLYGGFLGPRVPKANLSGIKAPNNSFVIGWYKQGSDHLLASKYLWCISVFSKIIDLDQALTIGYALVLWSGVGYHKTGILLILIHELYTIYHPILSVIGLKLRFKMYKYIFIFFLFILKCVYIFIVSIIK